MKKLTDVIEKALEKIKELLTPTPAPIPVPIPVRRRR